MPARLRDVLITAIVSVLLVGGSGYWYTNYVQRQADHRNDQLVRDSEQKWCAFVVTLDDAWSAVPPTSPLGQRVAEKLHKLRTDFDC